MACPDCGSSFGEYRISSSLETHGLDCGPFERFEQEFIVCRECDGNGGAWVQTNPPSSPAQLAVTVAKN